MQAIWYGTVIAEADKEDLIYIERNWYFPPSSITQRDTPYTCPWKGDCQYFDVGAGEKWSHDNAWTYPNPKRSAIDTVKKDFSGYVAFWHDVEVKE